MGSVKFLDSYLFLHMRLANFPKSFGLVEMKKGYFPHLANTPASQNYVGTYFQAEMYIPGQMSEKDRAKFYQWYNAKKDSGTIFDFRREMEEYCRIDVDILRLGCACFRKILIDISWVDPFTESCTIAQACLKVWRKNNMPEDCIAIIPPEGYSNQKNYSIKAVRWIQSEAKKLKLRFDMLWMVGKKRFVVIRSTDITKTPRHSSSSTDATGTDAQNIFQTEIRLIHTIVETCNNFTQKLLERNWR